MAGTRPVTDILSPDAFVAHLERHLGFGIGLVPDPDPGSPGMTLLGLIDGTSLARVEAFVVDATSNRTADSTIGPDDDVYMRRWKLWEDDGIVAKLHAFHRSDDDRACHDHPWDSLSICLSAGGQDISRMGPVLTLEAGMVIHRTAEYAHMIAVDGGSIVRTLFLTGPKVREWGFTCRTGWRHWRDFTSPTDGSDSGAVGRGCD